METLEMLIKENQDLKAELKYYINKLYEYSIAFYEYKLETDFTNDGSSIYHSRIANVYSTMISIDKLKISIFNIPLFEKLSEVDSLLNKMYDISISNKNNFNEIQNISKKLFSNYIDPYFEMKIKLLKEKQDLKAENIIKS